MSDVVNVNEKRLQLDEHILLRPDWYISTVNYVSELMWVWDIEKEMMIQRVVKYVPGLYKIFDEILVNAANNKQRDKKMDCIKIDIDVENNRISVWNNGKGIPVMMHEEEMMFVPTVINGYGGAKLCNIFSRRFTVKTGSREYKKSLKQTWRNNMGKVGEPRIKEFCGEDFTKITFSPDLAKFKMKHLDDDIVALMSRRAYDIAACSSGVKVFLNGTRIGVENFKDYVDLHVKGKKDDMGNPLKIAYETCGPRWEVAVTISDKGFQQMSFVNGIATTQGGRHVDYITDLIVKNLKETVKKRNKGAVAIEPFLIKNHLWIFVNCLINNPTFDSRNKDNMILEAKSFGSKFTMTDEFVAAVSKIGIVKAVLSWTKFKAESIKLNANEIEDANDAGTEKSLECTLVITEGDAARAMAVSGIAAIGRDKYGIFGLKGKIPNVRAGKPKKILENKPIHNLIETLGLKYGKKYETRDDMKTLRYGKMMMLTNQDQEGSHTKGLLINLIHCYWPSLLKLNFIDQFITPIVKVTKGNYVLSFFSLPEFEVWKKETENFPTYEIKYYKGLSASTANEAEEYFGNMTRHKISFIYLGKEDDQNIEMAFSRDKAKGRKEWLTEYMKGRKEIGVCAKYLYEKDTKAVTYSDFINFEFVRYSYYDTVRTIPSMIDGFRPGERKVMFTCLDRDVKCDVKVTELAHLVGEHSTYHHGEAPLMATIVNLAQNPVGTNNINLLQPIGQFSTRLRDVKEVARSRNTFTKLSPLARFIFHKSDDAILEHEYDDNKKIQPVHYLPIIPLILVNGAFGVGTGWSTKIPNFDPRDIIENLYRMIDGGEPKSMVPYYKNFKGTIESRGEFNYLYSGEISVIGPDKVEITELPVGTLPKAYKKTVLNPMLHGDEKTASIITDYKDNCTDTRVHFIVTMSAEKLGELERDNDLHRAFKLQKKDTIKKMWAFDENLCLQNYENVTMILRHFYKVRLEACKRRKHELERVLAAEAAKLSNQANLRDEKVKELRRMESRTPQSLWKEDLDNLLTELNKVEAEEEEGSKKTNSHQISRENIDGYKPRRILPTIDDGLREEIEKPEMDIRKRKDVKKPPRVKRSAKNNRNDSDSDEDVDTPMTPRAPRAPRRASCSTKNYNLSSDEDMPSSPEPVLHRNEDIEAKAKSPIQLVSDSDEEMLIDKSPQTPPSKHRSEELLNSVRNSPITAGPSKSVSSSSEDTPVNPNPPKKSPARGETGPRRPAEGSKRPAEKSSDSSYNCEIMINCQVRMNKIPRRSESIDDSPVARNPVRRSRRLEKLKQKLMSCILDESDEYD